MIPLKQVLSPQDMEAIFVNLEVRNCSSKVNGVYTARLDVSHTEWIIQYVYGRLNEPQDVLYTYISGVWWYAKVTAVCAWDVGVMV